MEELVARIREALDETERIARAAKGEAWELHRDSRVVTAVGDDDAFRGHGYKVEFAEHIAHNDPARVLRRVAADRKILDLHRNEAFKPAWDQDGPLRYTCSTCSERGMQMFDTWCDTVLALAEAYGIEVSSGMS